MSSWPRVGISSILAGLVTVFQANSQICLTFVTLPKIHYYLASPVSNYHKGMMTQYVLHNIHNMFYMHVQ